MTRFLVRARSSGFYRSLLDLHASSPAFRLVLVAALPLAWIVVANVAPLLQMGVISLYDRYPLPPGEEPVLTFRHYAAFLERPLYLSAFLRSFVFATGATLLTLVTVFPVAYYVSKVAPANRRTRLLLLVIAPFWVSEIIRSFAWILMLANRGAVNSLAAWLGLPGTPYDLLYNNVSLTIGVIYLTSLYMLLPLYAALEKIDRNVLEAASDLGAPAARRFFRIVLPLSREGVVTGCTLVFLLTVGLFAMPQLLGGPDTTMFAITIGQVFAKAGNAWPLGSAFSLILLAAALAYVGLFMLLFQPRRARPS